MYVCNFEHDVSSLSGEGRKPQTLSTEPLQIVIFKIIWNKVRLVCFELS